MEYDRRHDWAAPIAKLKKKIASDQQSLAKLQKELVTIDKQLNDLSAVLKTKTDASTGVQKQLDAKQEKFKAVKKDGLLLPSSAFCICLRLLTLNAGRGVQPPLCRSSWVRLKS